MRPSEVGFYKSAAWVKTREMFMESKGWVCELCGMPACTAHHKIPLTIETYGNPEISLNPALLLCVCRDCHAQLHSDMNVVFDESGDVHAVKDNFSELKKLLSNLDPPGVKS